MKSKNESRENLLNEQAYGLNSAMNKLKDKDCTADECRLEDDLDSADGHMTCAGKEGDPVVGCKPMRSPVDIPTGRAEDNAPGPDEEMMCKAPYMCQEDQDPKMEIRQYETLDQTPYARLAEQKAREDLKKDFAKTVFESEATKSGYLTSAFESLVEQLKMGTPLITPKFLTGRGPNGETEYSRDIWRYSKEHNELVAEQDSGVVIPITDKSYMWKAIDMMLSTGWEVFTESEAATTVCRYTMPFYEALRQMMVSEKVMTRDGGKTLVVYVAFEDNEVALSSLLKGLNASPFVGLINIRSHLKSKFTLKSGLYEITERGIGAWVPTNDDITSLDWCIHSFSFEELVQSQEVQDRTTVNEAIAVNGAGSGM